MSELMACSTYRSRHKFAPSWGHVAPWTVIIESSPMSSMLRRVSERGKAIGSLARQLPSQDIRPYRQFPGPRCNPLLPLINASRLPQTGHPGYPSFGAGDSLCSRCRSTLALATPSLQQKSRSASPAWPSPTPNHWELTRHPYAGHRSTVS